MPFNFRKLFQAGLAAQTALQNPEEICHISYLVADNNLENNIARQLADYACNADLMQDPYHQAYIYLDRHSFGTSSPTPQATTGPQTFEQPVHIFSTQKFQFNWQ